MYIDVKKGISRWLFIAISLEQVFIKEMTYMYVFVHLTGKT